MPRAIGGTGLQAAEKLREIVLHPREVHFVQQHQKHLAVIGRRLLRRVEHVKVQHRLRQFRRAIPALNIVVETQQILRAVPSRLHSDLQKVDAHRLGVPAGKLALAGAADAGEHRQRARIADLERRVERLHNAILEGEPQRAKPVLDLLQSLILVGQAAEAGLGRRSQTGWRLAKLDQHIAAVCSSLLILIAFDRRRARGLGLRQARLRPLPLRAEIVETLARGVALSLQRRDLLNQRGAFDGGFHGSGEIVLDLRQRGLSRGDGCVQRRRLRLQIVTAPRQGVGLGADRLLLFSIDLRFLHRLAQRFLACFEGVDLALAPDGAALRRFGAVCGLP